MIRSASREPASHHVSCESSGEPRATSGRGRRDGISHVTPRRDRNDMVRHRRTSARRPSGRRVAPPRRQCCPMVSRISPAFDTLNHAHRVTYDSRAPLIDASTSRGRNHPRAYTGNPPRRLEATKDLGNVVRFRRHRPRRRSARGFPVRSPRAYLSVSRSDARLSLTAAAGWSLVGERMRRRELCIMSDQSN